VLFLVNAATVRNAAFVQLDAICGFFVVWFFWVWTQWLVSPTRRGWLLLIACLTLGIFQKTTLFPLLAIPTLTAALARPRGVGVPWRRVVGIAAASVLPPVALFGGFLWWLGVTGNFGEQVHLMGTGWNELDFSFPRFVFATGFLLGPYLPLACRNQRLREPMFLGLALFVGLFFLSLVAVRGPFWSRYYSLVVAPTLLLALPFLARAAVSSPWRVLLPVYVIAVAAVHYAMMAWHIF
jgi:hypothetical protein